MLAVGQVGFKSKAFNDQRVVKESRLNSGGVLCVLKGSSDAKFTFTCCLNINVCWQCVYTSGL